MSDLEEAPYCDDLDAKALEVARLVVAKRKAYGNSFAKTGEVLKVLYPRGISVEEYPDALTIVRVIDKLFRVATDRDAFGESPWKDIMGYALLALQSHDNDNDKEKKNV